MSIRKISILLFATLLVILNAKLKSKVLSTSCPELAAGSGKSCYYQDCSSNNGLCSEDGGLTVCSDGKCKFAKGQSCRGGPVCASGNCNNGKCA